MKSKPTRGSRGQDRASKKSRKSKGKAASGQPRAGTKAKKREETTRAEIRQVLKAIAAGNAGQVKKRTLGLDHAIRRGLTRNEAAALVNSIIGGPPRVTLKEIRVSSVG